MPLTFQNLPRHCPVVIIHIQLFESKGNFWRNRLQLLLYLCKMFPKGSIIATAGQGAINNITKQGPRCSKRNVTQHLNWKRINSRCLGHHVVLILDVDDRRLVILALRCATFIRDSLNARRHHWCDIFRHRVHPLGTRKSKPRWKPKRRIKVVRQQDSHCSRTVFSLAA